MPKRLHRYYGSGYFHFITTSCYHRRPLLGTARRRDLFLKILEEVRVRYGFMNRPDVTRALELCSALGLEFDMMETSFFLSRQKIVPSAGGVGMAFWRDRIFAAMARNAGNISDYFNIPTNRVVELGTRVLI